MTTAMRESAERPDLDRKRAGRRYG